MKIGSVVDGVRGVAFGAAIATGIVVVFATIMVLSFIADAKVFAEREPALG